MNSDPTPPPPPSATSRPSGLAIASFVLGILSFGFWILTGLPAVICGHLSLSKIKKASGTIGGRGFAIAGLITGYIGIVFSTLVYLFLMGAVIYKMAPALEYSKATRNKADIQGIRTMLLSYNGMNGSYPESLSALVPRLMEELPKDAYSSPYVYRYPGRRNPDSYDLFSPGPDKIPDTADDDWGN